MTGEMSKRVRLYADWCEVFKKPEISLAKARL